MTVHDVAARSGVSIATVSRTLRWPHRVSEETRDRVLAAVQDLGYQPNRAARGLRGGRTGVIALVVPDIENPYFSALTKGAQASARARGYGLVVIDTTERSDVEAAEIRAVAPQIDGIILASSRLPDDQLAQTAAANTCVLVNRYDSTDGSLTPTVTIDEAVGALAAVQHLYDLGHRRLLYVGGPERAWSQARRSKAIHEAAAGFPDLTLDELGGFSPDAQGGREAADAARASGAQAVIAYNDLVALGLLARWSETGIRVPDDLSLLGFDNTYVAELSFPPLTSVGADLREFGETAVALLLERIDQPAEAVEKLQANPDAVQQLHREVPPQLVVRASTAAPSR